MKPFFLLFAIFISLSAFTQKPVTTIILVRHAEKADDSTKDPDLSDAGKQRAESLAKLLAKTKVDAIYSTAFKRTRNTAAPLAQQKGLTIETYNPSKPEEIDAIIQKFSGGTILLVGHSNTTPAIINYLTGRKDEYKTFDDADYGNIVIASFTKRSTDTKLTWLTY
ncbi:MAG: phosphoglycerate mutase family protein [Bacteroidota bacterium]